MEVRWMPTVADVEPIQEILQSIEPGAPLVHGALTVIPLLTPSSKEVDWVTLEEAGDDAAFIAHALGNVARARGMGQLAKDTGLTREGLYKALNKDGNPSFATVLKVMKALGLNLTRQVA